MFPERLKELRKANGLTQTQFAATFNVASGTVAMWETDKRKPDIDTLKKLADFFSVSVDYLIGHSNYNGPTCVSSNCWDGHHIRECREQIGETPEETAKSINVSVSDYLKYENAKVDPPISVLHGLADHFCTSIDFLLNYVWGMYDTAGDQITGDFKVKTPEEQRLVERFRHLEPVNQGLALGYIDGLLESKDGLKKSQPASAS